LASLWVAEVVANSSSLDSLSEQSSGFDVRLWREDEDSRPTCYFWASPHLDVLTDAELVRHRAAALRAVWHGAQYVAFGQDYSPLRIGSLRHDLHGMADIEMGDPYSFPYAPEVLTRRWQETSIVGDPLKGMVDFCLALARHDQGSRERIQALGIEGPTYTSLFRLYEDMTKIEKWSDARIDREGGAPHPVATRFRATANNPFHSGAASRHGGPGSPPMSQRPVTLREAGPVMLKAYARYLVARGTQINLRALVS
jgi:hypothetical protein